MFYFLGNTIQQFFNLAIPGSIIALLLLFSCLCLKIIPVKFIEDGAGFLLGILMLLFIPKTVGIMNYPSLLSVHGALLIVTILLSTFISIGIAGTTIQYIEKKVRKRKADKKCSHSA